jgi:hypothetical protein
MRVNFEDAGRRAAIDEANTKSTDESSLIWRTFWLTGLVILALGGYTLGKVNGHRPASVRDEVIGEHCVRTAFESGGHWYCLMEALRGVALRSHA